MGHTHKYQFDLKKKSPSIWSSTPNSVRICQTGWTGFRGVTKISFGLQNKKGRAQKQRGGKRREEENREEEGKGREEEEKRRRKEEQKGMEL